MSHVTCELKVPQNKLTWMFIIAAYTIMNITSLVQSTARISLG